jgi:multiple antibiotic resistance protein
MSIIEFSLLAVSSIFAIVDPIAVVPAFIMMTPNYTPEQRIKTAKLAALVTAGVLIIFSVGGKLIFRLLGITLPAFQLAGSIVLLLVALDMVRARRSAVQETVEETVAGAEKEDIAITPLAVPMLAGPGAITTVIILQNQAVNILMQISLFISIIIVSLACYFILRWCAYGAKWLSPIALKIGTRIMGLLLAAIAMQFFINAIEQIRKS